MRRDMRFFYRSGQAGPIQGYESVTSYDEKNRIPTAYENHKAQDNFDLDNKLYRADIYEVINPDLTVFDFEYSQYVCAIFSPYYIPKKEKL